MWRLLLVALLACAPIGVEAKTLFVSPFELGDTAANGANNDFEDWITTVSGADNTIGVMGQIDCTASTNPHRCCSATAGKGNCAHDAASGGHVSSHRALQVNVASSGYAYVSLQKLAKCTGNKTCQVSTISSGDWCDYCRAATAGNAIGDIGQFSTISAAFNVRFDTLPSSGSRSVFQFIEGDSATVAARVGCEARVHSTGAFSLWYNGSQIGSTSAELWRADSCSTDRSLPCTTGTVSTDCPAPSPSCTACSTSAPGNCYWAQIGVAEVLGAGNVTCSLYARGKSTVSGTVTTSAAQQVDDVHLGAPGSEAVSMQATFDDFVLTDQADPGWGYVMHAAPGRHGTCSITTSRHCNARSDCPSGEVCLTMGLALGVNLYDGWDSAKSTGGWSKTSNPASYSSTINDSIQATRPYKLHVASDVTAKLAGQTISYWSLQHTTDACAVTADCTAQDGAGTCTNGFCSNLTNIGQLSVPEASGRVTAVQTVLSGSTDNNDTASCPSGVSAPCRELGVAAQLCPYVTGTTSVSCAKATSVVNRISHNANDAPFWLSVNDTGPGGTSWNADMMDQLGVQINTTSNWDTSGSRNVHVEAIDVSVVVRQGLPPQKNLHDNNKGVKACRVHADCGTSACSSATDYTSTDGKARTCGWCEGLCAGGTNSGKICAVDGDCPSSTCQDRTCVRDGKLTVASIGDSTNGGTVSSTCSGGTAAGSACSQKDFCSWDVGPGTFQDHPPGGCNQNNDLCHTCAGRSDENGGFGWNCCPGGTCSNNNCPVTGHCHTATGFCYNTPQGADTGIACCTGGCCGDGDAVNGCGGTTGFCFGGTYDDGSHTNTSCDTSCGNLGGTCRSTATCLLACPGGNCTCSTSSDCNGGTCTSGVCQSNSRVCSDDTDCAAGKACSNPGTCPVDRAAWGAYLSDDVTVDYNLVCSKGGEKVAAMLQNRFDNIATSGLGCVGLLGTGRCTCTTDADCGSGGTCCVRACTCATGSDCGSGGVCTSSVCTAGTTSTCTQDANCNVAGGKYCTPGCDSNTVNGGTCRTGSGAQASCDSQQDCGTNQSCAFPAPDLIATLEGYNDAGVFTSPNCYAATGAGQFLSPCNPAVNPLLPAYWCLTDADATAATGSSNSQCVGVRRDAAGLIPGRYNNDQLLCLQELITGNCTVTFQGDDGKPTCAGTCSCTTDANCDGTTGSCLFGVVCNLIARSCTVNGDCDSGKVCSVANCTGGVCAKPAVGVIEHLPGNFTTPLGLCHEATCPTGFTKVNDICHFNCTTDESCGNPSGQGAGAGGTMAGICTNWCSAGSRQYQACSTDDNNATTGCPPSNPTGRCSGQKVCQGRASIPSDARTCTTDADCRAVQEYDTQSGHPYHASPLPNQALVPHLRLDGTCVSGKCQCTGIPSLCTSTDRPRPTVNLCPAQTQAYVAHIGHYSAIFSYHQMERRIAAFAQSVRPSLLFATLPASATDPCWNVFPDWYVQGESAHIKSEFPLWADSRAAFAGGNELKARSDGIVHFSVYGAGLAGRAVRDVMQTLNTCVKDTGGTTQFYCVNPAGAFTTSGSPCKGSCTAGIFADGTASSGSLCTVNGDCGTTSSPTCTTGSYCMCQPTLLSGGGKTTGAEHCPAFNTCQLRPCTSGSDCPAGSDSCHAQP